MIDTTKYKTILEDELETLKNDLANVSLQNINTDEDWIATSTTKGKDLSDPEQQAVRLARNDSIALALEQRLRNVMRALDKMENNKYGICEISGDSIEVDRLDANPAARTNIANLDKEDTLEI